MIQLEKCSEGHSELHSRLCEPYFGAGVFINGGDILKFLSFSYYYCYYYFVALTSIYYEVKISLFSKLINTSYFYLELFLTFSGEVDVKNCIDSSGNRFPCDIVRLNNAIKGSCKEEALGLGVVE